MSWFTGGSTYHNLLHCMHGDVGWVLAFAAVSLWVWLAYNWVAYIFMRAAKNAPDSENKRILKLISAIFVFCGFCGYLSRVISVWWPGYRLVVILELVLALVATAFAVYSINRAHILFLGPNDKTPEESLFERIWDSTPLGLLCLDERGRICRANDAATDVLGLTKGQLEDRDLTSLVHTKDLQDVTSALETMLGGESPGSRKRARFVRPSGAVSHCVVIFHHLDPQAGKSSGGIVQLLDVTPEVCQTAELTEKLESTERALVREMEQTDMLDPAVRRRLEKVGETLKGLAGTHASTRSAGASGGGPQGPGILARS